MTTHSRRHVGDRGSASVELAGWIPLLVLLALVAFQALAIIAVPVVVEGAARTGSHAGALGMDPVASAIDALPGPLRGSASVEADGASVRVSVRVPGLLPADWFGSQRDVTRSASFPPL